MRAFALSPLRSRSSPWIACALVALAGCGGDDKPPPQVAHESAAAQLKRVATRWGDTVEDRGFLENDPNGVTEFLVTTTRTLTLGDGLAATLHVERDERFVTKLGNFRCVAKGDVPARAAYTWNGGEAQVRIALAEASLPRRCDPPSFPVTAKVLPSQTMVLLLRSDRLLGRSSARDRTVLLPLQ